MCIETGNPIPGRDIALIIRVPKKMPNAPPIKEIATDSLSNSLRILPRVKPSVRRTATSRCGVRGLT